MPQLLARDVTDEIDVRSSASRPASVSGEYEFDELTRQPIKRSTTHRARKRNILIVGRYVCGIEHGDYLRLVG